VEVPCTPRKKIRPPLAAWLPASRRIIYKASPPVRPWPRGGWRQLSKERKIEIANPAG